MDISSNFVAKAYEANRPATAPNPANDAGNAFGQAAAGFVETLQNSEKTAMSAMSGGADPHALVQALAQTELAIETVVTVRNKVVEAYQEILRMPV
jgi:flagellar hook-basal body complex protein FliE